MEKTVMPIASMFERKNTRKNRWRQWITGYLMIFPNFLGFFIFMLAPIIATAVLGFTEWDLVNVPKWVGLGNYKNLFGDRIFWLSFRKTIWFTLLNVPIQSFLALLIAVLLNRKLKALNLFRTLFIIPWICMSVAVGLTWTWLFNTQFGYINHVLTSLGFARVGWLTSDKLALYAVIFVNIWQYLGWHIILLLAGLQIVPHELYEAATVDGANNWVQFWKITIPMISPIFFYDLVVNMIMTLQIFDLPFAMTNGGPGNATRVFNLYLYQKGFSFLQMGEACSMAGFAFGQLQFPGRDILFFLYLGTMMVPGAVILIPSYYIILRLNMANTFAGLILPFFFGSAFGTFLLRQFYMTLPKDLFEAATIDGAGYFQIWLKVMLPLSKPAVATLGVMTLVQHWNNLLWPLVITQSPNLKVLAVGLSDFRLFRNIQWNSLMAAVIIAILPMLVILFIAQKYFVRGIQFSGINR